MNTKIKILGIGGSLRKGSFNKSLLFAAKEMCPETAEVEIYERLSEFPPYNQDIEAQGIPEVVKDFKQKIREADAILISSPEYNYTIPGFLKNAIDWASRPITDNPFDNKPVALMSAATGMLGGSRMQYHMRHLLVYLNMHPLNKPEVIVSFARDKIQDGKVTDEHTRDKIKQLLEALIDWTQRIK